MFTAQESFHEFPTFFVFCINHLLTTSSFHQGFHLGAFHKSSVMAGCHLVGNRFQWLSLSKIFANSSHKSTPIWKKKTQQKLSITPLSKRHNTTQMDHSPSALAAFFCVSPTEFVPKRWTNSSHWLLNLPPIIEGGTSEVWIERKTPFFVVFVVIRNFTKTLKPTNHPLENNDWETILSFCVCLAHFQVRLACFREGNNFWCKTWEKTHEIKHGIQFWCEKSGLLGHYHYFYCRKKSQTLQLTPFRCDEFTGKELGLQKKRYHGVVDSTLHTDFNKMKVRYLLTCMDSWQCSVSKRGVWI